MATNKKTQYLEERKEKLIQRINETKEKKQKFITFVNTLTSRYHQGLISYPSYKHIIYTRLKQKTPHQWIEHYDTSIRTLTRELHTCIQTLDTLQQHHSISTTIGFLILTIAIFSLIIFFQPSLQGKSFSLTGYTIGTPLAVVNHANQEIPTTLNQLENTTTIQFTDQAIETLTFTNLQGTTLTLETLSEELTFENALASKVYGLNLNEISFDNALLTTTATDTLLYSCSSFDFSLTTCLTIWEFVQALTPGEFYTSPLSAGSIAFAEAHSLPSTETAGQLITGMAITTPSPTTTFLSTETQTETLTQTPAEIRKPVKWVKEVQLNKEAPNVTVTLPKDASFGKVHAITQGVKKEILANQLNLIQNQDTQTLYVFEQTTTVAVEYSTEPPEMIEEPLDENSKRIQISSATHYTNILAYTSIPESKPNNIHLFWIVNQSRQELTNISYKDTTNNGLVDVIEWIVPSLSNQTYEILITQADHLDENRAFVSDIYEQVKEQDNIWSETIPENHYVRVVFEQDLTATNDITLYPRIASGNPTINIYEMNGNQLIASFQALTSNAYNRVLLTNLQGSQDTFDLQIIGGSVAFDHIIDPPVQEFFDPCANLNNWASTGTWVASVKCDARNTGSIDQNLTLLTALDLSASNITYANLSFSMANVGLDSGEYLRVLVNSSTTPFVVLIETASATAQTLEFNLSEYITLDAGVHLRFTCKNSANTENCTIDNINVTSFQQGANTAPNNPSEVIFNSSDQAQTNYTFEDLVAGFLCDDPDTSDTLTYDLDFIVDGVVNQSLSGISCADPEYVTVLLDNLNTTKGENWSFSVNVTDAAAEASSTVFSNNVTILNSDPVVFYVSNVSGQSVTEANVTFVEFSYNATDADGTNDLDDTTAQGMFNLTGEEIRMNQSCGQTASLNDTKEYNCTIGIQWYDAAGEWTINASVQDVDGILATNDTTSFPLFQTTAIVLGPSSLTWPEITLTSINILSNSDPVIINNTANKDISAGGVTVTALDLQGVTITTEFLNATNFTVNTADACDSGTIMVNGTATVITGSSIPAGNFTIGDGSGQEELYFCLEDVTAGISPQDYSTSGPDSGAWVVEVS